MITNPFTLAFAIALPILMYMMFGAGADYGPTWIGHANIAAAVLVNMTVYGAIMTTSSMGANVSLERTSGVTRLFALTPMSSLAIIAARIVASIGLTAIISALTFGIGYATGSRMEPAAWIVAYLLILVLSPLPAAVGLAAGFATRSDGAFAMTSIFTVISSFLSGMFIPLDQMGSFFGGLAPFTPLYGMIKLASAPLYGWDTFSWSWVANYVVWTAALIGVAVWGQRRDTGR